MSPPGEPWGDLRDRLGRLPPDSGEPAADLVARDQDERWRRGERVLIEAYLPLHPALGDPAVQADLVYAELLLRESHGEQPAAAEYCDRFPLLAERIRSLFRLHEALRPALDDDRPAPGIALPGFEILNEIGRGGMGVVYRARQLDLGRIVAVKVLRPDANDPDRAERLRREAEALARVRHPGIVQVYEVRARQDQPVVILEYIDGATLAERLRSGPLPPREAAGLIRGVADAIHAAHEAGLVHRDLKPANILVVDPGGPATSASSTATTKVTDFGLAKLMDQGGLSQSGEMIGTPSYMAPEQASGGQAVGPAADVYALGAILYECLTGRPPFTGDNPLSVLMLVANAEPVPPTRLRAGAPRDLEAVCLRCLEKSPTRRYATAASLRDDLDRYLDGRPTDARPLSLPGRCVRLLRRHPLTAGLIAAVAASLVGGMLGVIWQWRQAVAARADEADRFREAEQNLYASRLAQSMLLWDGGDTARARELLARCHPAAGRPDLRGWEWYYLTRMFRPERHVEPAPHWVNDLALIPPADGRAAALAVAVGKPRYTATQPLHPDDGRTGIFRPDRPADSVQPGPTLSAAANAVAVRPDGGLIAWGALSGEVVVTRGDATLVAWSANVPGAVYGLKFTGDGQRLVVLSGGDQGTVSVLDSATGAATATRRVRAGVTPRLAVQANGPLVAVGGRNRRVLVLRLPDLAPVPGPDDVPTPVTALEWSPDGTTLAIGETDGAIRFWEPAGGRLTRFTAAPTGPVYALALSADGRSLFTGGSDKAVRQWDVVSGKPVAVWRGHEATVRCIAIDPAGRWVAAGGQDASLRVWDRDLQAGGRRLPFHNRLNDVAVVDSPDGPIVRAVALNGLVRSWSLADRRVVAETVVPLQPRPSYPMRYAAFLDSGRLVVGIPTADPTRLAAWNAQTGGRVHEWPGGSGNVRTLATDRAGRRLVWATEDDAGSDLHWWDGRTLDRGRARLADRGVRALAIAEDGRHIAALTSTSRPTREASLWLLPTNSDRPPVKIARGESSFGGLAFRPDGRQFAAVIDGVVHAFESPAGDPAWRLPSDMATCLAYSADGRRLAAIGYSGTVTVIRPATGHQVFSLPGLAAGRPDDMAVDARVAFDPSGEWLIATNWDGSVSAFHGPPADHPAPAPAP